MLSVGCGGAGVALEGSCQGSGLSRANPQGNTSMGQVKMAWYMGNEVLFYAREY